MQALLNKIISVIISFLMAFSQLGASITEESADKIKEDVKSAVTEIAENTENAVKKSCNSVAEKLEEVKENIKDKIAELKSNEKSKTDYRLQTNEEKQDIINLPLQTNEELTSGQCGDNVYYSFDSTTGTLTISGTGDMWDHSFTGSPFYNNKTIQSVIIEDGVTNIGDYAFYNCLGIKELSMPCSAIFYEYTFSGCSNIEKVTLTKGTGTMRDYSSIYFDSDFYGYTPWCYSRDNIKEIVIENGVTNIGSYAFYDCSSLTGITIPDDVTNIGDYAFFYCSSLTGITIPDDVTNIGDYAFYNCSGIKELSMPCSAIFSRYTFSGCSNIEKVTLTKGTGVMRNYTYSSISDNYFGYTPWYYSRDNIKEIVIENGVTNIGSCAFYYCSSLTSIHIPDSVTNIGSYAFYNCSGIKELSMPCSAIFSRYTFSGCSNIEKVTLTKGTGVMCDFYSSSSYSDYYGYTPWYYSRNNIKEIFVEDGVKSIGAYAFYDCINLSDVTLPDSVEIIGEYAFDGTTLYNNSFTWYDGALYINNHLIKVDSNTSEIFTVKEGTKCIAEGAFRDFVKIESVYIPNGVVSIGNYAFYGCNRLENITIPDSITNVGNYAFYNCSHLGNIHIPDSVTNIGYYAFYNCSSLTGITIPDDVTNIGDGAFYNCSSLTGITIPDDVTNIGDGAFSNCSSLTSIHIPDSVTNIGDGAFSNCSSLTSIHIPDSVTNIGSHAFYACSSLTGITIPDDVTNIGDYAFYNCSGIKELSMPCSATFSEYTFSGCSNIEKVTLTKGSGIMSNYSYSSSSGNYSGYTPWYYSRDNIKEIIIENGVTNIGGYAFYNCSSLTGITIPDDVTNIGDYAFYNCSGIKELSMPCSAIFSRYTFSGCSNIEKVTLTKGTGTIRNFYSSSSYYDYYGYTPWYYSRDNIRELVIEDGVTSIGSYAFYNCYGIKELSIPCSVTLGSYPFSGCSNIEKITITKGNGTMTDFDLNSSNNNYYANTPWYTSRNNIKELTLENGIKNIGDYAFYNCSGIINIDIPESVTKIGYASFKNCGNLTEVTIPLSTTKIGSYAFDGCADEITVNYNGYSADWDNITMGTSCFGTSKINKNFIDSVDTVSVKSLPDKTNYFVGDTLDTTGMILEATLRNKTTSDISTGFTCSPSELNTAGEQEITVTYDGKTTAFTVNVVEPSLIGITVKTLPDITEYYTEETVNLAGLVLSGTYNNGKTTDITDGFTATPEVLKEVGENTITVNYNGFTTSFKVNVKKANITGLAISKLPDKTVFFTGDELDTTGLVLSASYEDGRTKEITGNFTCDKTVLNNVGENEITVTFSGKTVKYTVNVVMPEITGISIKNLPDKTSYFLDDTIDTTGLVLECKYNNGKTEFVTDGYTLDCDIINNAGVQVITVNYNGFTATFKVEVLIAPVSKVEVIRLPDKTTYFPGESLDVTGLVLKLTYEDGKTKEITEGYSYNQTKFTSVGTKTVTVRYGNKIATFDVTVKEPDIISVEIIKNPVKQKYVTGDTVDLSGLVLKATYENGKTKEIASGYKCANTKLTAAGDNKITVTYGGKATTFNVTVYDGLCGKNLYYIIDEAGKLTVSGNGDMSEFDTLSGSRSPFYKNTDIKEVVFENGVTGIGSYAFYGCTNLTTVTVPDSVKYVGAFAFKNCSALSRITGANNIARIDADAFLNTAYYNNSANWQDGVLYVGSCLIKAKTDISGECEIQDGTKAIAESAFEDCTKLSAVIIPDTVEYIGNYAFCNCTGLTELVIPGSAMYEKYTFKKCSNIEKVTVTGNKMLNYNADSTSNSYYGVTPWYISRMSIKQIILENSIENIGDYAFYGCTGLTKITIPEAVTKIAYKAFCNCSNLSEIRISANVEKIYDYAFDGCSDNITIIFTGSFEDWDKIIQVVSCFGNSELDFTTKTVISSAENVNVNSLESENYSCEIQSENGTVCTGSKVIIKDNSGNAINGFTAVVFGDADGNGVCDGNDAVIVEMLVNGMLTKEQVGDAVYSAADCNDDGEVNQADVDIMIQNGLLADID